MNLGKDEVWPITSSKTLFTKTGSGLIWPVGHSLLSPGLETLVQLLNLLDAEN